MQTNKNLLKTQQAQIVDNKKLIHRYREDRGFQGFLINKEALRAHLEARREIQHCQF
jgi:hypothetical protein